VQPDSAQLRLVDDLDPHGFQRHLAADPRSRIPRLLRTAHRLLADQGQAVAG